jgi:dTDP-4-dehydrorhamnose reductase
MEHNKINKIIILGPTGMLGNYIKRYFQMYTTLNVICIDRTIFDAFTDDISKLENILKEHLNINTLVFNAIGIIPQALINGQNNDDLYMKINKEFPNNLCTLCNKYNAKMIHPSTDCVYLGTKGKYSESDAHDELNMYGVTKSLGEPKDCTVIRVSIIGEEVNSHKSLLSWVKQNKNGNINGYGNHYWNGITCLQYAKIVEQMINQNIFWKGVRHLLSPRTVSKYELCNMINEIFELNIKINNHETTNIVDKSLVTIYDENNIFNIPDLNEQILDLKKFSDILHCKVVIPKIFYSYWDGSPLSYLQYLTVVTFQEHNPDWKVIIYMPTNQYIYKTWSSSEQKTQYTGKNYLPELFKLNIEIKKVNFDTIGFKNNVSEVIKSDYLRYWILGNYGGLWSDMDVIYIKPIDTIYNSNYTIYGDNNINTVVCYFKEHYPIGFLMSSPNNPYYLNLMENASKYLNIKEYQSIGCHLLKKLFNTPSDIKITYPELNILVAPETCYLPYAWDKINDIFVINLPDKITNDTIGIHWFNGSNISVKYENMIDNKTFPRTGSIYKYVQKYLDKL